MERVEAAHAVRAEDDALAASHALLTRAERRDAGADVHERALGADGKAARHAQRRADNLHEHGARAQKLKVVFDWPREDTCQSSGRAIG